MTLARHERARQTKACADGAEQHREAADNLIEARRQADAANASAALSQEQTGIAAWGAALGLLTLLAAGAAAFFAGTAAYYTRRSNELVEDERRPWIEIIDLELKRLQEYEGKAWIEFAIKLKNAGVRPATNIVATFVLGEEYIEPEFVNEWAPMKGGEPYRRIFLVSKEIMPKDSSEIYATIVCDFIPKEGGNFFYLNLAVGYTSFEDKTQRMTSLSSLIGETDPRGGGIGAITVRDMQGTPRALVGFGMTRIHKMT